MVDEILKPCPFCGKRAIVMRVKDPVVLEKLQVHGEQYMIGCVTKGCILHANKTRKTARLLFGTGSYDNMVKMWNRRDGDSRYVTLNGKRLTIAEFARTMNISQFKARYRIELFEKGDTNEQFDRASGGD